MENLALHFGVMVVLCILVGFGIFVFQLSRTSSSKLTKCAAYLTIIILAYGVHKLCVTAAPLIVQI